MFTTLGRAQNIPADGSCCPCSIRKAELSAFSISLTPGWGQCPYHNHLATHAELEKIQHVPCPNSGVGIVSSSFQIFYLVRPYLGLRLLWAWKSSDGGRAAELRCPWESAQLRGSCEPAPSLLSGHVLHRVVGSSGKTSMDRHCCLLLLPALGRGQGQGWVRHLLAFCGAGVGWGHPQVSCGLVGPGEGAPSYLYPAFLPCLGEATEGQ